MQNPRTAFMLLLATGYTIVRSVTSENVARIPCGPKLCSELCQKTCGCASYAFKVSKLLCRLKYKSDPTFVVNTDDVLFSYVQSKDRDYEAVRNDCPENSKIISTRSQHRRRVIYRKRKQHRLGATGSQLLVAAYSYNSCFRLVNLKDNSVMKYTYLNLRSISAIAYISSSNTIFVASYHDKNIMKTSLYDKRLIDVQRRLLCYAMAVDQSRQLVCLTAFGRYKGIFTMNKDGKNLRIILKIKEQAIYIAVDTIHQVIYTSTTKGGVIFCFYNGTGIGKILLKIKGAVAVDKEQTLYYYLRPYLYQRKFHRNESFRVMSLPEMPIQLLFHKNNLYLSSVLPGQLTVVNDIDKRKVVRDKEKTYRLQVGFKHRMIFCLIP